MAVQTRTAAPSSTTGLLISSNYSGSGGGKEDLRLLAVRAKRISISVAAMSVPLLYASLLHASPSGLLQDTRFWFLMSNAILVIVAADSGVFSSSDEPAEDDLYQEYERHSGASRHHPSRPTATTTTATTSSRPSILLQPPNYMSSKEEEGGGGGGEADGTSSVTGTTTTAVGSVLLEMPSYPDQELASQLQVDRENQQEEEDSATEEEQNEEEEAEEEEEEEEEGEEEEEEEEVGAARGRIITYGRSKSGRVATRNTSEGQEVAISRSRSTVQSSRGRWGGGGGGVDHDRVQSQVTSDHYYSTLSDEELNRRVEEFIRSFNREIRLQEIRAAAG